MVEFGSGRGGRLKLRKLEHKVLVVNLDSSSSIPLNSVDTNRTTDVYAGGTNMDNAITISATTNMDNAITISATNSTPTQIKDSERGRRLKLQKLEQKVPVVVDLDSNSGIADNIVETKTTADVYACGTNLEDVIVIRSKNSTTTKKNGRNHLHVNDSRSRNKKSRYYIMKNTTCLKRRLFHLKRSNYRDCDRTEHIKKTVSERSRLASNQEVSTRMRRCSRGTSLLTSKHVVERRNSTYEEARSEPSFRKRKMVQIGTSRFQTKQTYYRYIQKKLSPNFFSNMLSELSGEQKKWVEKTGFGNVLAFRMKRYAHKLGYAIVEALDRNDCSIRLQDGNIKISDVVVQMVLGLPKGEEDVDVQDRKELLSAWESQFDGKPFSKITATMIAKQIKSHGSATNMFKLNFLVLLSNFLVESNNNGYVKTDIVGFCGNIEKCSKYNWCGFVIDKLLTTHEFWAGNPSIRHFTGSLPLLTYLYLDRVSNARTQHVERTKPAYIAWTDELIKEEENYIIENNCFGKGEILEWPKRGAEEVHYVCNEDSGHTDDSLAENWVQGHEGNHESHVHNLEEDEGAITECVGLGEDEQESDVQVCEKAICETVPSLLDENLEELLDDQKFMERFDSKLEALELLCKGCIADHGTALAMYPDHPKTTILKEKLAYIFETQFSVFEHTTKILETPIMSKYQCSNIHEEVLTPWSTQFVEVLDEMGKSVSSEKNEQSFKIDARDEFPSFSLNLTPSQESVELEKMIERDACIAKTVVGVKQLDNMEVRRACRTKKLPATKKSPYVTRVKFIIAPALNSEGHAVWEWLFDNRKCLNQKLFKWKNTGCNKEQLQTLMPGEWVEGNVIDTWTHILNERESRRSDSLPLRLFCTIDSTVGPLTSNYMSELDRCVIFAENMDLVLLRANMLQNRNYREIDFDMYLFPIHKNGHHYMISYNIKYPAWEIIDNIGGCTDFEQRYGALPYMLHNLFVLWMQAYEGSKWKQVEKLKPEMVEMSWQTKDNSTDCGIFVMRHMESYMGKPWKAWHTGLYNESAKQRGQLVDLRKMYCHDILGSNLNANRENLMKKAWEYMKGKRKKPLSNATTSGKVVDVNPVSTYAWMNSNVRKKK